MKHIIFGGFDYAVRHEMNSDAVLHGIDYFVDNDPALIGTTYLNKPIKSPDALLEENKDDILILIGSIVYRTEIAFQLRDMGFEEDKHFIWAIAFTGDSECQRLWRYTIWKDNLVNKETYKISENSLAINKIMARFIDFEKISAVLDLGACIEILEKFLPEGVRYIPVDYEKFTENTILCDFNRYEFPTPERITQFGGYDPHFTAIVCGGAIQYVSDWKWFLRTAYQNCRCLIIHHGDFRYINRDFRMDHWMRNNALFNHEIILYAEKIGFQLTDAVDFRLRTTIMKFEKKEK